MNEKLFTSLGAESEMKSIIDYMEKGDFKQAKKQIDRNLEKSKGEGDKLNFKILNMLYFHKIKKFDDCDKVKSDIRQTLMSINNQDILKFFKKALKDIGDQVSLGEILRSSLKQINWLTVSQEEQNEILKEMTAYCDFQEIYKIVNSLDKNPNIDKEFQQLLKYEVIYNLCVKFKKLPAMILSKSLKDLQNSKQLSQNKGFIDMVIKYNMASKDYVALELFLESNIKTFSNSPIFDLLCETYYKQGKIAKCVNFLYKEISVNLDKCIFTYFERLINLFIHYLDSSKFDYSNVDEDFLNEAIVKETNVVLCSIEEYFIEEKEDSKKNLAKLLRFLKIIANNQQIAQFSSFKSSNYSILLLLSQFILKTKKLVLYEKHVESIITILIPHAASKQTILFEITRFFIFLNQDARNRIYKGIEDKESRSKDEEIFLVKLEGCFGFFTSILANCNSITSKVKLLEDKIVILFEKYLSISKEINKIEKGERILGDDIIIVINEHVFWFLNYFQLKESNQEVLFIYLGICKVWSTQLIIYCTLHQLLFA
jgi:hypothetical protein